MLAVRAEEEARSRVVFPRTESLPDVVAFPSTSTVKALLAVQVLPFQYSVWLVTVPSAIVPVTVVQYVEVPFVASTCPTDPVALLESRSSPVIWSLEIVEEAR